MVRHATLDDIPRLLEIYAKAREIMKNSGNLHQWNGEYPGRVDAEKDIADNTLYVVTESCAAAEGTEAASTAEATGAGVASTAGGRIYGAFTLIDYPEPTYTSIREGSWMDDTPYGTIHRIASDGSRKGVFGEALRFAKEHWSHLRIDTHVDNVIMRHVIPKEGFVYRGVVTMRDGTDRLAYEYVRDLDGPAGL